MVGWVVYVVYCHFHQYLRWLVGWFMVFSATFINILDGWLGGLWCLVPLSTISQMVGWVVYVVQCHFHQYLRWLVGWYMVFSATFINILDGWLGGLWCLVPLSSISQMVGWVVYGVQCQFQQYLRWLVVWFMVFSATFINILDGWLGGLWCLVPLSTISQMVGWVVYGVQCHFHQYLRWLVGWFMVFSATFNNILDGWLGGLWCLVPLSTISQMVGWVVYGVQCHFQQYLRWLVGWFMVFSATFINILDGWLGGLWCLVPLSSISQMVGWVVYGVQCHFQQYLRWLVGWFMVFSATFINILDGWLGGLWCLVPLSTISQMVGWVVYGVQCHFQQYLRWLVVWFMVLSATFNNILDGWLGGLWCLVPLSTISQMVGWVVYGVQCHFQQYLRWLVGWFMVFSATFINILDGWLGGLWCLVPLSTISQMVGWVVYGVQCHFQQYLRWLVGWFMVFSATFNNILDGWLGGLWCLVPLSTIFQMVGWVVYGVQCHFHQYLRWLVGWFMVFSATFNNILDGWLGGLWCLVPLSTISQMVGCVVYGAQCHFQQYLRWLVGWFMVFSAIFNNILDGWLGGLWCLMPLSTIFQMVGWVVYGV